MQAWNTLNPMCTLRPSMEFQVEELNLFTERLNGLSKGSGFVTMQSRDQAMNALDSLDEQHTMEVRLIGSQTYENVGYYVMFSLNMQGSTAPLSVKWADPDLQIKKKKAVEGSNVDSRMVCLGSMGYNSAWRWIITVLGETFTLLIACSSSSPRSCAPHQRRKSRSSSRGLAAYMTLIFSGPFKALRQQR